jgi:hypothetical protein
MSAKSVAEILGMMAESELSRARERRTKFLTYIGLAIVADVGALVFAWQLWGWRAPALLVCAHVAKVLEWQAKKVLKG